MSAPLLIRCSACGATNRVPQEKLGQGVRPVCGQCKAALPASSSHPITVTDASFSNDVEQSPLPVLLDVWAPWCHPCHMIAPTIEELAVELAGRLRVAKLNLDENPVTASRFRIQSIPALLVFRGGQEVDRIIGVQPKADIARRLQRLI
jgi:thioredoxin 2